MKIGILGGAFNPPHNGHLVIAGEAFEKLGLDKIFFIPTNISPHKQGDGATADLRLEMTKSVASVNKNFEVLGLEIKRGGTSFTIDTIRELKANYPQDDFYLIIGSDLANCFENWRQAAEIKKLVRVVVAKREDYPLQTKSDFIILDITQIYISSSQIREKLSKQESVEGLVPEVIIKYIEDHNLYSN